MIKTTESNIDSNKPIKYRMNAKWVQSSDCKCDFDDESNRVLYQDINHPHVFCFDTDDYNKLGYYYDRNCGEVISFSKFTKTECCTQMEMRYGVWTVIETPYGTSWNFSLYKTYKEALEKMYKGGR